MPFLQQPRINYVTQQHENGCAVACAAMITGSTYWDAFKIAFGPRSKRRINVQLTLSQIASVVRKLGFRCRKGDDWLQRQLPAILMFEWDHRPGTYHCIVYDPFGPRRFNDPGGRGHTHSWSRYVRLWRRSGYMSLIITGRR